MPCTVTLFDSAYLFVSHPFLGIEFWVDVEWEPSTDEIPLRKGINRAVANPRYAAWLLAAALDELE